MRFHPTSLAMRDAVADGSLGDVFFTDVRWMRSAGIPGYGSWFTRKELAGAGALFDIGVHMLDLGMFASRVPGGRAGGRCRSAADSESWASGSAAGETIAETVGSTSTTPRIATLALAGGGTLRLHVAWASFCRDEERVTVQGTLGGADRSAGLYGKDDAASVLRREREERDRRTTVPHAGDGGQWFEGSTRSFAPSAVRRSSS